jgi:hypothetical protein
VSEKPTVKTGYDKIVLNMITINTYDKDYSMATFLSPTFVVFFNHDFWSIDRISDNLGILFTYPYRDVVCI